MVMTCRHVQQLRDAYLDGELSVALTAEVHAHLLQCPACQREVEIIRVAGSVIAGDRSEPSPPRGLADRVVAALPGLNAGSNVALLTRRTRRRKMWRRVFNAGVPAAAAMLFFCVLVWPSGRQDLRPTMVKGKAVEAVGATTVVDPTVGVLNQTRRAAESVDRILAVSADKASRDVQATLTQLKNRPISFLDMFLEPFSGLLDAPQSPKAGAEDQEVIRF